MKVKDNRQNDESIIEFLQDGFLRADTNGKIIMANDRIAKLCGYTSSSDMLGTSMNTLYADSRVRKQMLSELDKNEKLVNIELELQTRSGEVFWTNCNIKKLYDENGKLIGTEGLIRDITKEIISKEKIESLARFPKHNPFPVFRISSDGALLYHNKSSERLLKKWEYFKNNSLPSTWKDLAIKTMDTGEISSIEVKIADQTFMLSFAPVREKGFINVYGLDITDLKKMEDNLRKINQQLIANEQQLQATNQQLTANEQQLRAANQQLIANEQQLRAANQQLTANEQQLLLNQEKLKTNETRFERAQEIGHIGNWEYNLQTTHFWGSKEAKKIYGFDENYSDFTTDEVEKCIPERERVHQVLMDLIRNDIPYDLEFQIITRDKGESKTIHSIATLERDPHGKPLKVSGLVHDITESKKAQEEIEKLAKFPAENPFPVLRISSDGKLLFYNKSSIDLLKKWQYFKDNTLPTDWVNFSQETFKSDLVQTKEVTVDNRVIALTFAPIKEKGFLNVYGLDVSKRIEYELKMLKALKKAEEADRLKSAFLANMSHEIRTPMNGILGFTDLLQKPNLTYEDQNKYLDIIKKSGERMLNTVNDLINISKIETGQEEIHPQTIEPYSEIMNICDFFKPATLKKGLDLKIDNINIPQNISIKTDLSKFNSIITNLIKNAIKFTDRGEIRIGSEIEDGNILFWVKDTGIGIPKNRQDIIFERFIQADIYDRRALQGFGLGLAIIKAYVEMLRGRIWFESEEGKGSCFYVSLPLTIKNKPEIEIIPGNINTSPTLLDRKLNALIAEDDDISYQHLSIILEPYVNKIVRAHDGEEALSLVKTQDDLDLILMDINMPKLDGLTATTMIREFDRDIVIIAQTAYALLGDKEKALEAGCNDYISKPIQTDRLLETISKHSS